MGELMEKKTGKLYCPTTYTILAIHDRSHQGHLGWPAAFGATTAAEAGAVVAAHVAPADAAAVPAALAAVAVAHPPSFDSDRTEILQLEPISSIGR